MSGTVYKPSHCYLSCCSMHVPSHKYVLITTTSYTSMVYTYIHVLAVQKICSLGGRDIHVTCMHPKHTHTPVDTHHHHLKRALPPQQSHPPSLLPQRNIHSCRRAIYNLWCVCTLCVSVTCVNMCITPSSNLAPYSNHTTGHTHALTPTHTHPHSHSHVFAHRMSRPFPSLPPPSPPHKTCLTLCLILSRRRICGVRGSPAMQASATTYQILHSQGSVHIFTQWNPYVS